MTGAYGMLLPLMFAAMIGTIVAKRICNPSIYEALSDQFLSMKGLDPSKTPLNEEAAKQS